MIFDVACGNRRWEVVIEPGKGGTFGVIVDGRRRQVDAVWAGDTLSLIEGTASHQIRIHPRGNGAVGVEIRGRLLEMLAERRGRSPIAGTPTRRSDGSAAHAVRAPMPGRVVRLLVAAGDRVAARQPVVVVEAMKMENELRTPREGTVKEIAVTAGAAVESGAIMVVIGD